MAANSVSKMPHYWV